MDATVCQAVNERRVIELRYHGYSRIVEPHIYGADRHGEEVVRCYQLAGGSESGEHSGWKLLKLRDALVVYLAETRFEPRPEYQRDDRVVQEVYCAV